MIEAAAVAQSELRCPLTIHPGRGPESPAELVRIVQEAGGDASKTVMDHLDSQSIPTCLLLVVVLLLIVVGQFFAASVVLVHVHC